MPAGWILKAWNIAIGGVENVQASKNMLSVIDAEHKRIHDGLMYMVADTISALGSGDSKNLLIRPLSREMHLRLYRFGVEKAPMAIAIYGEPYIDANSLGTLKTPQNLNREVPNSSTTLLYEDTFFDTNSAGEQLDHDYIVGGKQEGGSIEGVTIEWIIPASTSHIVSLTNNAGAVSAGTYKVMWYELED